MKISDIKIPDEVKNILQKEKYTALYPPQRDALQAGVLEGKNIVLASPTASGKTLIAELCSLRHVLEKEGKALYLTPLRALTREKYVDFKKYQPIKKKDGRRVNIAISTGDYDSTDPWLGKADIILATNEKADSLLRHKTSWMEEISLVIADEIHLLTDPGRGPTLEIVLARLKRINPEIQFIALSATIENTSEVADWMNAIPILTEWRPVPLKEGVYCGGELVLKDAPSRKILSESQNAAINLALDSVRGDGQALIFTETRRSALSMGNKASLALKKVFGSQWQIQEELSRKILSIGERTRLGEILAEQIKYGAGFHHAGLKNGHRKLIEDSFRKGEIKILAATPTLAAGVNLPARTVIINSYERYEAGYGRIPISVLEYKQFCGRAGRPKYDSYGEAILLAKTPDEQEHLFKRYVLSRPEKLWSKLAVEKVLRPHVLSTIAMKFASTEEGLNEFFSQTFFAYQYGLTSLKTKLGKILRFLYEEGMIKVDGDQVLPTFFGQRVSELYLDPASAVVIRDGLARGTATPTDLTFLHLITRTPDLTPKLYPRRRDYDELSVYTENHQEEFLFEIPDTILDITGYEEFLAEVKSAKIILEWINETSEDDILRRYSVEPGDLSRLIELGDWLLYSVEELSTLFRKTQYLKQLRNLRERVKKGIKQELIPLARLKGVGRIRARTLYNAGFKSIKDLREASSDMLSSLPLIGPILSKKIIEQVKTDDKKQNIKILKGT